MAAPAMGARRGTPAAWPKPRAWRRRLVAGPSRAGPGQRPAIPSGRSPARPGRSVTKWSENTPARSLGGSMTVQADCQTSRPTARRAALPADATGSVRLKCQNAQLLAGCSRLKSNSVRRRSESRRRQRSWPPRPPSGSDMLPGRPAGRFGGEVPPAWTSSAAARVSSLVPAGQRQVAGSTVRLSKQRGDGGFVSHVRPATWGCLWASPPASSLGRPRSTVP